jgi:hypothetical protein
MLIKRSSETGMIIVVPTMDMRDQVKKEAFDLGLNIPDPITIRQFIVTIYNDHMMHKKSYLIDELQLALRIMGVDAATVDCDSVKEDFE